MSGYIGTQPVPQATQHRETFTATASQTTFATVGYTPQFVDVYLNGIHLLDTVDYTATNSSDVVLTTGAAASDVVEIISYTPFEVANQTFTGTTTVDALTATGAFTSLGIDDNATATAMTLDASGNLLVGKTASDFNTQGFEVNSGGQMRNSRAGGAVAFLNRKTDDGSVVDFGKDGTVVGSISVSDGDRLNINSGSMGFKLYDDAKQIIPTNGIGANSDAQVTLGSSAVRFKDLYLSGGVYLGGTGAANKLDDYEEGTWTPVFSDAASGGNTATGDIRGIYTKIGNQVTVNCSSSSLVTTGMTGANDLFIRGLPFAPSIYSTPNQWWHGGTRLSGVTFSTSSFVSATIYDTLTYVRLSESMPGASVDNIICSELASGAAAIQFTITYQTDS